MATTVKKAPARRGAKKAAAKKAAAKKTTARKAARKAPAKKAASARKAAKKAPARKAASRKASARKAPRKAAAKRAGRRITPERALANTRRLLEAKQAHDRETPPWQALDGGHAPSADAGFQDPRARDQANALHAAESDMDAIHGASGMQDRHNQGRRDKR